MALNAELFQSESMFEMVEATTLLVSKYGAMVVLTADPRTPVTEDVRRELAVLFAPAHIKVGHKAQVMRHAGSAKVEGVRDLLVFEKDVREPASGVEVHGSIVVPR